MQNDTPNDDTNTKPVDAPIEPMTPTSPAQPDLFPFTPAAAGSAAQASTTEANPTEDNPVTVQPPKKSKKKLIIIGSIIAGALLILGGGSALAYNVWYQNSEKVVTDALINAVNAHTAQVTGSLETKSDDFQMKATFDSRGNTDSGEIAATVDITSADQSFKLDGVAQYSNDGNVYVKVNNVQDIFSAFMSGDSTAFDDLSDKISGKWIKITNDDIGELSAEYKKTQLCVDDVTKQLSEDKSLSKEVVKLYKDNRFIVIEEKLGSRTIDGVGSLGYVVDLDAEKAKAFAAGLETTEIGKKFKACDDTIDFKEISESIDTSINEESDDEGVVEVWASRFGHQLTEINAHGTSDGSEVKAVINPVFNKDVTVDAPKDALTVEDLKAEFEKATEAYYTELYSAYSSADTSTY